MVVNGFNVVVRLWARRKPPLDTQWYLSDNSILLVHLVVNKINKLYLSWMIKR